MKFKKIQTIRKKKSTQKVYNFSVPGPESYIADNRVVHNCYVKKHAQSEFHTLGNLRNVIEDFYLGGGGAWANQITISIDDPPNDNTSSSNLKKIFMVGLFSDVIRMLGNDNRADHIRPEVHMTFHTLQTLLNYANIWTSYGLAYIANKLDVISLSTIKPTVGELDIIKLLAHKNHVNYNYLIPTKILYRAQLQCTCISIYWTGNVSAL